MMSRTKLNEQAIALVTDAAVEILAGRSIKTKSLFICEIGNEQLEFVVGLTYDPDSVSDVRWAQDMDFVLAYKFAYRATEYLDSFDDGWRDLYGCDETYLVPSTAQRILDDVTDFIFYDLDYVLSIEEALCNVK